MEFLKLVTLMKETKRNRTRNLSLFSDTLRGKSYAIGNKFIPPNLNRSEVENRSDFSIDKSADIDLLYERKLLPKLNNKTTQCSIFSSTPITERTNIFSTSTTRPPPAHPHSSPKSIRRKNLPLPLFKTGTFLPESPPTSPRLLTIPSIRLSKKSSTDQSMLATVLTSMIEQSNVRRHRLLRPCNRNRPPDIDIHTSIDSTHQQAITSKSSTINNQKIDNIVKNDKKTGKLMFDVQKKDENDDNFGENNENAGFGVIYEDLRMFKKRLEKEFIMGKWNKESFDKNEIGSGLGKTTWIPTQSLIKYLEDCNLNFQKVSKSFASSYKLYTDLCDLTFFRDFKIEDALTIFALGIIMELPSGWSQKYYEKDKLIVVLRGILEVSAPTALINKEASVWPKFTLQEGEGLASDMVSLMLGADYQFGRGYLNLTPIGNVYILSVPYSSALDFVLKRNLHLVNIWKKLHTMSSMGILCSESIRLVTARSRLLKLKVASEICKIMTTGTAQQRNPFFSIIIKGRVEVSYSQSVPMKSVDMFGVEDFNVPDNPPEKERVIEVKPGEIRKDLVHKRMKEIKGEFAYPVIRVAEGRLIQGYRLLEHLYMYLENETYIPANTPYTVTVTSDELYLLVVPIDVFKVLPQRELIALLKLAPIDDLPDSLESALA